MSLKLIIFLLVVTVISAQLHPNGGEGSESMELGSEAATIQVRATMLEAKKVGDGTKTDVTIYGRSNTITCLKLDSSKVVLNRIKRIYTVTLEHPAKQCKKEETGFA